MAEDVFDAAKDGNVKLFVVKVLILQWERRSGSVYARVVPWFRRLRLSTIATCQVVKVFVIILPIAICPRRNPRQACP